MYGAKPRDADWVASESEPTPCEIVYGEVGDGLVFISRRRARELAGLHEALRLATWGELRSPYRTTPGARF